ncbi:hypothetical protein JCM10207_001544 [Rhodosporidiobolus poonsookiae]
MAPHKRSRSASTASFSSSSASTSSSLSFISNDSPRFIPSYPSFSQRHRGTDTWSGPAHSAAGSKSSKRGRGEGSESPTSLPTLESSSSRSPPATASRALPAGSTARSLTRNQASAANELIDWSPTSTSRGSSDLPLLPPPPSSTAAPAAAASTSTSTTPARAGPPGSNPRPKRRAPPGVDRDEPANKSRKGKKRREGRAGQVASAVSVRSDVGGEGRCGGGSGGAEEEGAKSKGKKARGLVEVDLGKMLGL